MSDAPCPVRAFALASTLQPKSVAGLFAPDAERVKITKTMAMARYPGPSGKGDQRREAQGWARGTTDGWAVAYDFGAVVFIGIEEAERARVMREIVAQLGSEPRAPAEETFAVQISPGTPPAVRFDRAIVPALDARGVEIIALVVAQSVAMEYYEGDVDALVSALEQRSKTLAAEGRLRGGSRALLQFIGRGMTMHTQVVHTLSLLDSPGATWDDEPLDRLYRGLRASFEIEERYRALDHELRIVQDNLELMVDLARQRRFIQLEVAVAIFVAAELLVLVGQIVLGWKAGP